jgi:L-ascorbate metabolism protein UlaG (beta-lactamase superfamily)
LAEIHFLGHSFFRLGFKEGNVLIDPFICNTSTDSNFKRVEACPVKLKDLNDVALILITHEHFDHFDKATIESLAKRHNSLVVATQNVLNELDLPKNLCIVVDERENARKTLRGFDIEARPVHHPRAFHPISFIVRKDKQTIYHAGDTSLINFDGIKADVALLPIGGTFTMDVVDAVRATKTIKPEFVVPMHYNTFGLIKADPREFVHKINKSILKTKPVVLAPGEKFKLTKKK